jgi:hypothetical protein
LVGEDLHGPFRYEQSSDPGTIGAGAYWLDTDTYTIYRRNATNDGWNTVGGSAGIEDPTTAQGDLIVRGASDLDALPIGAVSTILRSNGVDPVWSAAPTVSGEMTAATFKATGSSGASSQARLIGTTAGGAPSSGANSVGDVAVDATGKLFVCTAAGTPGTWVQASGGMSNPMTVLYDLILGGASGTPTRLAVGANGQVLGIDSGVVGWINNPAGFVNPMTTIGDMIYATTGGDPDRIPNGANGQVLTMIAGLPGWANPTGGGGGSGGVGDTIYLARSAT